MNLVVHLDRFEGPLALLLHLIRREEMDIFDINIHQITTQYLDFIKSMKQLDLENAGDFVAMAATLIQIKSKLLLPQYNEEGEVDESTDPRKELVSRLLEYQKYQDAAKKMYERPLLGRDWFARGEKLDLLALLPPSEVEVEENALFSLISCYRLAIRNMKKGVHEVAEALQSIAERILEMRDQLVIGKIIGFFSLIDAKEEIKSSQILVTFISLLELAKMGFVSLFQAEDEAEIRIQVKNAVDRNVISRVESYDNSHSEEVVNQLIAPDVQGSQVSVAGESEMSNDLGASDDEILAEELRLESLDKSELESSEKITT